METIVKKIHSSLHNDHKCAITTNHLFIFEVPDEHYKRCYIIERLIQHETLLWGQTQMAFLNVLNDASRLPVQQYTLILVHISSQDLKLSLFLLIPFC